MRPRRVNVPQRLAKVARLPSEPYYRARDRGRKFAREIDSAWEATRELVALQNGHAVMMMRMADDQPEHDPMDLHMGATPRYTQ